MVASIAGTSLDPERHCRLTYSLSFVVMPRDRGAWRDPSRFLAKSARPPAFGIEGKARRAPGKPVCGGRAAPSPAVAADARVAGGSIFLS